MKYKVGDRVKCSCGYGVIEELLKANNNNESLNFYSIKLDKPIKKGKHFDKFSIKNLWYAENELQPEKETKYLDDYKNRPIKSGKKKGREISL